MSQSEYLKQGMIPRGLTYERWIRAVEWEETTTAYMIHNGRRGR